MADSGYAERDAFVKLLGFDTYKAYLASDFWRSIRERVLATPHETTHTIDGRTSGPAGLCVFCERDADNIHHASYDMRTLAGVSLEELYPLCRSCHESLEFDIEYDRSGEVSRRKRSCIEAKSYLDGALEVGWQCYESGYSDGWNSCVVDRARESYNATVGIGEGI